MHRSLTALGFLLALLLVLSCHEEPATRGDAAVDAAGAADASHPDAATADAGADLLLDASPAVDASPLPDIGAPDAATPPADASAPDAQPSPPDAGSPDAGAVGYTLQVLAQFTDALHDMLYLDGTVYAVSSATNEVLAFSATTYQLEQRIAVGLAPGNLSTDGQHIFVMNRTASAFGVDAYLSVIDPATKTVVKSLKAATKVQGSDPNNYPTTQFPWAATPLDGTLYITFPTNAQGLNLMPVTIGSWTEGKFWPSGSGPDDLVGANGRLFVINGRAMTNPNDDAIAVFQPDGTAIQTLETSGRLIDVVATDHRVWASRTPENMTYGEIVIIDDSTLALHSVEVCVKPYQLAISGRRIYTACQIGTAAGPEVDALDIDTEALVEQIPLWGFTPAITSPRGIAVSPRGDIFLESDGMLSVLVKQ